MSVMNIALGVWIGLVVFACLVFVVANIMMIRFKLKQKAQHEAIEASYNNAMASISKRIAENEAKHKLMEVD